MKSEDLDLSQINNLLRSKERVKKESPQDRWPNSHREALREAIESGESFIEMDGMKFIIGVTTDKFHLRPAKGFAPCGWFPRKWLYEETG
jgi:hypothetical protein